MVLHRRGGNLDAVFCQAIDLRWKHAKLPQRCAHADALHKPLHGIRCIRRERAALLAAKDPQKALADHEAAGKGSSLKALKDVPPAIQAKLAANMQLMEDLELQATPAIFYMDDKGELQPLDYDSQIAKNHILWD